jgi:hypothetical protein
MALINGFWASQAVITFSFLGLPELMAGGRRTTPELARATGTHAPAVRRLLRALAALGVVEEVGPEEFALSPLGEGLLPDAPGSLAGWAALMGTPNIWQNWGQLADSIRTGKTGWELRLGTDAWTYRAQNPEEGKIFDRAMVSATSATTRGLADAFDFSRFRTIVDVGGGQGTLLGLILQRHPSVSGVLFDQPQVVEGAPELLGRLGVLDRCQVVAGSFFESVPAGGDAYLLKSVIHDWYEREATQILTVVRQAMRPGAVLLLVERVLEPAGLGASAKLGDLNMLVNPGGMERTEEEYARLFEVSGFRLDRVVAAPGLTSVLESAPVA